LVTGFVLALGIGSAGWAGAAGLVTIVDGEATVIDGGRALLVAEGQKLADESLLRTSAKTSLVRVEWPDGVAADFGPDTQAMISPPNLPGRSGKAPLVYLLSGWVKLSSLGAGSVAGLVAPRVDAQAFKGALLVLAAADETWVFAESGSAPLVERDIKPTSSLTLKNGEVYLRTGAAKGTVAARPSPTHMQRVPRGFRDSLPLRSAALKDKSVTPRPAAPPTYADLRDWLAAEQPLRKNFTRRFAERARDGAFRAGLAENLARHPEWEPVLFPERFTKPASAPR
jgi:hypothetical protein